MTACSLTATWVIKQPAHTLQGLYCTMQTHQNIMLYILGALVWLTFKITNKAVHLLLVGSKYSLQPFSSTMSSCVRKHIWERWTGCIDMHLYLKKCKCIEVFQQLFLKCPPLQSSNVKLHWSKQISWDRLNRSSVHWRHGVVWSSLMGDPALLVAPPHSATSPRSSLSCNDNTKLECMPHVCQCVGMHT